MIQPLIPQAFLSGTTAYELVFNTYALFALEEKLGCAMQSIGRVKVTTQPDGSKLETREYGVRELLVMGWAGLEGARAMRRPNEAPMTLEMAGNILDGAGGVLSCAALITSAFMNAFPSIKVPEAGAKPADPTIAPDPQTGPGSSTPRDASE